MKKKEHYTALADGWQRWRGWRLIDAAELERGQALERPRVKLTDVTEMLDIATG